ncbi:MAG: hypothetical protein ACK5XN_23845 [Bacteroidota bacterium]
MRKHLALHNKHLGINNRVVLFGGKLNKSMVASGVAPIILEDHLSRQLGGLLIGDRTVAKGGKIKTHERRPIRFIV